MKSVISKSLMLVAVAATLCSFSNFGGEGFEIFINNKIVTQQFGKHINEIKSINLTEYSPNDQLTVKYHHCGQFGKNRVLAIKDAQNKIVKEWRFADPLNSIAGTGSMNFNVKEILSMNKGKESAFGLYYSSNELPQGRLLANIILGNSTVAKNK